MNTSIRLRMSHKDQRGVASILTVIFFILIISVITLGFMRMASLESEQTLEDSLSKSALAAAYSGVSDGKRALLYCLTNPTADGCDEASATEIFNPECPGFFGNISLRGALGIADPSTENGGVPVGDPAANERYTCVLVANDTWDVSGPLNVDGLNNTDLVPLRGVSTFSKVRISWQKAGSTVNLTSPAMTYNSYPAVANYRSPDAYDSLSGPVFEYQSAWPATLRASLFSHPNSYIEYRPDGSTNIEEKTAFLYPRSTSSGTSDTVTYGAVITRQSVGCRSGATGYPINANSNLGTYSCQLTISGMDPAANTMYLQLTNIFRDTDYVVELLDSSDQPVKFDDASPSIDATGAVENVFRRVQVRLRYQGYGVGGSTPILPNALDVGSGICKNFSVSVDSAQFRQTC